MANIKQVIRNFDNEKQLTDFAGEILEAMREILK